MVCKEKWKKLAVISVKPVKRDDKGTLTETGSMKT